MDHRAASTLSLIGIGLAVGGCALNEDDSYGTLRSEVNVSAYVSSGCSTAVVAGLSKQIADEIACLDSNLLTRFAPSARLQITSNAVLPYLYSTAKTKLEAVAATRTVQVNSAFRTVAQQYLLYRWNQLGRCNISAAATPGRSNHESGRALDLANYSSLISAMANQGWSHSVPGDPVHFDHLGSPDIRGKDVLAFQRLWNRNHPNDIIGEDGLYGPQTEQRLRNSPATGFAAGPMCGSSAAQLGVDVVMVEGPDRVAPGAVTRYAITVDNTGAVDWPADTQLVVADGAASPLYHAGTWTSPTVIGELASDIGAGAQGMIELEVQAPMATEETPVFTELTLTDGATTFGRFPLALTVVPPTAAMPGEPAADPGEISGDGDDANDFGAETTGGCAAGGGGGFGALGLVISALIAARGRRRRA